MMKSLHIIFALLIINGTLSQQLENSGFEQWENVGTGEEEPLSWSSTKTSDNSSLNGLAPQVISRSTDAHTGTYAAKLVNKNVPFAIDPLDAAKLKIAPSCGPMQGVQPKAKASPRI